MVNRRQTALLLAQVVVWYHIGNRVAVKANKMVMVVVKQFDALDPISQFDGRDQITRQKSVNISVNSGFMGREATR